MNIEKLKECVTHGSLDDALKIVEQHEKSEFAGDVCNYLIEQLCFVDCNLATLRFETLKKLTNVIVMTYDPMDVLLQLIEGFQRLGEFEQVKFVGFLEYLGKVTLRLPQKRYSSIAWALSAVEVYVKGLDLVQELLNEDEHEVVEKINSITSAQLKLYVVFVEGLNHDRETKPLLLKFVVHLLDKPFAFLNFEYPLVHVAATDVIEKLLLLKPDLFVLLDYKETTDLALGTMFFLVLCENVCVERLPRVYDSVFIFRNCLRFVSHFLSTNNEMTLEKNGLRFAESLLDRIKGRTLSHHILDNGEGQDFCMLIINVIIFNENQKHRTTALAIFKRFLLSFSTRGRYLLVYNLMSVLTYPGVRSYLITLYKDFLMEELDNAETTGELSVYFRGSNLKQTIDLFCETKSHKKPEDVLEASDPIIASINFLRFLISRDKNNVTQIWDNVEEIRNYLGKIGDDLKALKNEIGNKRRLLNAKSNETSQMDFNLSIPNQKETVDEMAKMSPEKQEKVYSMALLTVDVIDSLSFRLTELLDEAQC